MKKVCDCCKNKIETPASIPTLCRSCFGKYKDASGMYLDSINNPGDYAKMYLKIETAISESTEEIAVKKELCTLFSDWIFTEAGKKTGYSKEQCFSSHKEAEEKSIKRTESVKNAGDSDSSENRISFAPKNITESVDNIVCDNEIKSNILRMSEDIHFIKNVVMVYVILSIVAGLILGLLLL